MKEWVDPENLREQLEQAIEEIERLNVELAKRRCSCVC